MAQEFDEYEPLDGFDDGDEIIAEIEVINQKEGTSRTIECLLHTDVYDLEECEKDAIVVLQLIDGNTYAGRFHDADGENIVILPLDPEDKGAGLGFEYEWVGSFFLEIKKG